MFKLKSIGVELRPLRSCHFFSCALELCVMNILSGGPREQQPRYLKVVQGRCTVWCLRGFNIPATKLSKSNCCVSPSQSRNMFPKEASTTCHLKTHAVRQRLLPTTACLNTVLEDVCVAISQLQMSLDPELSLFAFVFCRSLAPVTLTNRRFQLNMFWTLSIVQSGFRLRLLVSVVTFATSFVTV